MLVGHGLKARAHAGRLFRLTRSHRRVVRVVTMRATIGRPLALPARLAFAVHPEGPVAVYRVVALTAYLVAVVKANPLARRGSQFVALFLIVTIETPHAAVAVI